MSVAVCQLWRGGGLAQPGAVPAVVMTSHRATVALLGLQGRDVLVVVRAGRPENISFICEKIFQGNSVVLTESLQEDSLQSSHRSYQSSDRTELSLGKTRHSRRHCPQHQSWSATPSHCPGPQSSPD